MKNVFAKLLEFLSPISLPVMLKSTKENKGFLKSRLLSFEQLSECRYSLMYYTFVAHYIIAYP